MRYIFLTLLLVNFGYLGYELFGRPSASATAVVTMPGKPAEDKTIFLLSEKQPDETESAQLDTVINNPVQKDDSAPKTCNAIGPFQDIFSGQALLNQLQAMNIKAALHAVDQPTGPNDYRVVIPPANSLQDAFRKLRELKSRNIDSYVITQGEHALAISLGLFSDEAAAKRMVAMREKQGYKADVVAIPRVNREFWVFPAPGQIVNAKQWQSLTAQNDSLQHKAMQCPAEPDPSGQTTGATTGS